MNKIAYCLSLSTHTRALEGLRRLLSVLDSSVQNKMPLLVSSRGEEWQACLVRLVSLVPLSLPSLTCSIPFQIGKLLEVLNQQMQSKGRELTEYRERYNIRLVGEDEKGKQAAGSNKEAGDGGGSKGSTGVLVS